MEGKGSHTFFRQLSLLHIFSPCSVRSLQYPTFLTRELCRVEEKKKNTTKPLSFTYAATILWHCSQNIPLVIGLEKIREESLYPLKQGLIGSWVKPEPSLKQCTSLVIITCSCIIKIAIITDMRSPDFVFGKVWKIFLSIIIKLTLKEKQAIRIPQSKPEVKSHHDTL